MPPLSGGLRPSSRREPSRRPLPGPGLRAARPRHRCAARRTGPDRLGTWRSRTSDPGFSDDDGSADPRLSEALAAWAADRTAEPRVLEALQKARLLVPVVAVLGEAEVDANGLRREKTSDMAVPTLVAGDRRALPAFTSTDALSRWDPAARPVAVPLHQALRAVAHEKADTLVLDMAGPVPFEITGRALLALAEGRAGTDPLTDPAVAQAVRAAVAAGRPCCAPSSSAAAARTAPSPSSWSPAPRPRRPPAASPRRWRETTR